MIDTTCSSPILRRAFSAVLLALLAACPVADASLIDIEFTGLDISYDGSDITAVADDLTSAVFSVGGVPVGSFDFTDDISIDLLIPSVAGLPAVGAGTVSTSGDFLDLDFPGTDFLDLDLGAVDVTVVNASIIRFTFGNAAATIAGQALPFGLTMDDPISVSFSTQLDPGSVTTAGGFLTGFSSANGTGEVREAIPEPTTLVMAAGFAALALRRRR